MKKLKLSEIDLGNADVLTRGQLKTVLGGLGPGSGGQYCGAWGTAHCGGNYIPKKCSGQQGTPSSYVVYCADPVTGTCYSFSYSSGSAYYCS